MPCRPAWLDPPTHRSDIDRDRRGPDPCMVDWHPGVIEAARDTGLWVYDEGRLVVATAAE